MMQAGSATGGRWSVQAAVGPRRGRALRARQARRLMIWRKAGACKAAPVHGADWHARQGSSGAAALDEHQSNATTPPARFIPDRCGGTVACGPPALGGNCPTGQVCNSTNQCETPETPCVPKTTVRRATRPHPCVQASGTRPPPGRGTHSAWLGCPVGGHGPLLSQPPPQPVLAPHSHALRRSSCFHRSTVHPRQGVREGGRRLRP